MPTKKDARIYYSLLFLCYLEVLLWTACILTGTFSLTQDADCTVAYCVRETVRAGAARARLPPGRGAVH